MASLTFVSLLLASSRLTDTGALMLASISGPAWVAIVISALFVLAKVGKKIESRDLTHTNSPTVGGFAAVAGCQEAIDDLREIVDFIKNPDKFTALGARTPRGALLVGPPGTGKTLLARAVAEEAEVPFFNANGSDFVEMYVGVGAQRIRELYSKARDAGRSIVFIDEIDAVARARNSTAADTKSGSQTEHENTLIALLTELDGFSKNAGVITIGATNRPDVLDSALTRPGRLERRVEVPNPDKNGREQILRVHVRNKPLEKDVDLGSIAARTAGMSGADLERVTNEAALIAAQAGARKVSQSCLDQAVEYVVMGRPRASRVVTERDRRITAWHEAGHALVALCLDHTEDPVSVSIKPRGVAGGVTWFGSSDDLFSTRENALDKMTVMLAGRAAEEIHLGGSCTQGAANDLSQATDLARSMLGKLGMVEGFLQVRSNEDDEIRAAVGVLISEAHERASEILQINAEALEGMVDTLLERDALSTDDVRDFKRRVSLVPYVAPVAKIADTGPVSNAPLTHKTATASSWPSILSIFKTEARRIASKVRLGKKRRVRA